jgi:hypothetical protein
MIKPKFMRKLVYAIAFGMTLAWSFQAQAQSNRAQSFYLEILGAGGSYSANYDTRFGNQQNGWGARFGMGYHALDRNSFFSAPVMVNYLAGKNGKYFEIGMGATYLSIKDRDNPNRGRNNDFFIFDYGDRVMGTMNIGFRRQPMRNGVIFRAGIAPVFGQGNFLPYWPYVSLGYKF